MENQKSSTGKQGSKNQGKGPGPKKGGKPPNSPRGGNQQVRGQQAPPVLRVQKTELQKMFSSHQELKLFGVRETLLATGVHDFEFALESEPDSWISAKEAARLLLEKRRYLLTEQNERRALKLFQKSYSLLIEEEKRVIALSQKEFNQQFSKLVLSFPVLARQGIAKPQQEERKEGSQGPQGGRTQRALVTRASPNRQRPLVSKIPKIFSARDKSEAGARTFWSVTEDYGLANLPGQVLNGQKAFLPYKRGLEGNVEDLDISSFTFKEYRGFAVPYITAFWQHWKSKGEEPFFAALSELAWDTELRQFVNPKAPKDGQAEGK
jgi:hypothetical protein